MEDKNSDKDVFYSFHIYIISVKIGSLSTLLTKACQFHELAFKLSNMQSAGHGN